MAERNFIVWHSDRNQWGNYSWCVNDGLVFVRTQYGQKCIGWRLTGSHYRSPFSEGIKLTRTRVRRLLTT